MKRLVLCCDGTWDSPVNRSVTNIVKIARSVDVDAPVRGVQQAVFYVGGVGAHGYVVDKVLGGAWGYGLTMNVLDGYRAIAINYEVGDEIFVLGFSRGAYTARSVAGMIATVGLLRADALVHDELAAAEAAYRDYSTTGPARRAQFKAENCYPDTAIRFLGVFDTVGALGVPLPFMRKAAFHDIALSDSVQVARQALSIDDRRITFEPCLWDVAPGGPPGRVKQVWFPGAHSDVGGGSPRCGLSDIALRWMIDEAVRAGLVVHADRVADQLAPDEPLGCDPGPGWLFGALNAVDAIHPHPRFRRGAGHWHRVLAGVPSGAGPSSAVPATPVTATGAPQAATRVSWTALAEHADVMSRVDGSAYQREAVNIGWWRELDGPDLPVEPIPFEDMDERMVTFG